MATKKAIQFFYDNAGYSYPKGASEAEQERAHRDHAKALAEAEERAEDLGWDYTTEIDPYGADEFEPGEVTEVVTVVLLDEIGETIDTIGGVGLTGRRKEDEDFIRVHAVEMMQEALYRKHTSNPRQCKNAAHAKSKRTFYVCRIVDRHGRTVRTRGMPDLMTKEQALKKLATIVRSELDDYEYGAYITTENL